MNLMDAIIVLVSGVIFGWVFPLIAWISGQDISAGFLRTISVLRAMRLLRIVRVIQRMPMFREVWLLLRGLTSSLRTLVWTVAVIFVLTYLFAILGCWLIGAEMKNAMDSITDQVELDELLATYKYVKGIAPLMQLLIQFLTLDSWNHKMERIMEYAPWCLGYFYTYIAVAVFVLMNLVTAIIVENAMSASKMDEDQRLKQMEDLKRKELKELEHLFYLMDADGDGTLDWEEFENAFMDEDMSRKWRLLDFQPEECKELFDLLDDGDGGIETKEFFHGLARMKGGAQSRDLIRVAQKVDRLGRDVSSLVQAFCLGCAAGSISGSETLGNPVSGADARFIQVRPETPGGRRMSVAIRPGRREQRSGSDIDAIGPKNGGKSPKSPKVGLEEAKRRMASMGRDAVEKGYGSEASGYSGSAVSGASALSDSR
ncbi:unnamed protein product [Effrenium voratum]|uniref:EF-hand domain-containing protein n=1 Tax=Effrenium voratum TaxID=2562239 RepID=A0AA36IZ71_9DINO|nr:unnamed protein product [Effrenium voratum]